MKAKRISYLDCPHRNVQAFSECCLDCGYNIYTSKKEYEAELRKEAKVDEDGIRALERRLGIG